MHGHRKSNKAAQAAGQAMIADLKELVATMKAGIPLESKYTVRTVEVADEPGQYDAAAIRATPVRRFGPGTMAVCEPRLLAIL
jgi:hypothetical protein